MSLFPPEWKFFPKFIALLMVALLSVYGGWYFTSEHYQYKIANMEADVQRVTNNELARLQQMALVDAKKFRQAEEQHATDQLAITRLGAQLAGVQLKLPAHDCSAVPGITETASNQNGTGGLAAARADEYLAEAQRAIQDIGQRCAQLNIDAIEMNAKIRND